MRTVLKMRSNTRRTPPKLHQQAFYTVRGRRPNRKGEWEPIMSTFTQGAQVVDTERLAGWVGRRREFHTVSHEKVTHLWQPASYSFGPAPGSSLSAVVDLSDDRYNIYNKGEGYYNYPQAPNGASLIPETPYISDLPLDWRQCYESLLDDAHGLLPAQKSLAVNVAEFTQVKRLVPGISKSISRILRWVKGQPNGKVTIQATRLYRGRRRRFKKTVDVRSMRWTLRDLSQLHLANQFGVQPLAADLGELAGKLWEVKMHQNWWKTVSDGRYHTIHASVSAQSSSTQRNKITARYGIEDVHEQYVRGTLGALVRITPVTQEVAQKRLFQQIIGWNVPLQIVWELVPFSFVVDWFLPVGQILSRFEPKRFFGSLAAGVEIMNRWHSLKIEATAAKYLYALDQSYRLCPPGTDPAWNLTFIHDGGGGKTKLTAYTRNEQWPDFNFQPPRGSFKLQQAGLSLALVVARLFK